MTDKSDDRDHDREGEGDGGSVPDTDPDTSTQRANSPGRIKSGEIDMRLADDADCADLKEFVTRAEAGEFGADPGVEANVWIAQTLLEDADADE